MIKIDRPIDQLIAEVIPAAIKSSDRKPDGIIMHTSRKDALRNLMPAWAMVIDDFSQYDGVNLYFSDYAPVDAIIVFENFNFR
jgi:hypothetical protein